MKVLSKFRKSLPPEWVRDYSPSLQNAVVIVGAGASSVLGYPIQNQLWPYLMRKTSFDQVRGTLAYTRSYFGEDVERAFTLLEIETKDSHALLRSDAAIHLSSLKSVIHHSFAKQKISINGEKIYRRFILHVLKSFKSTSIISLNWDTGLERVLSNSGRQVDYGVSFDSCTTPYVSSSDAIPFYKLHGSLNWWFCHNCKKFSCSDDSPEQAYLVGMELIYSGKNAQERVTDLMRRSGWPLSFKLNPKWDKDTIRYGGCWSVDVCPTCLLPTLEVVITPPSLLKSPILNYQDSVKRRAHRALAEAGCIIVIGSSWREADYDLMYLVKSAALRSGMLVLWILNDEETAKRTVRFFKRKMGSRLECLAAHLGYLDEHTKLVRIV